MDLQWWIDAIGKLGPLLVAVAVFRANGAQAAWNVAVAKRTAAMEDQKFRLALLERRTQVIEQVGNASWIFVCDGLDEALSGLTETLTTAQLMFGRSSNVEISECLEQLQAVRRHRRDQKLYENKDADRYQRAVDGESDAEARFFDGMIQLHINLLTISRVDTPPPLVSDVARGTRRWLPGFLRRRS